MRILFPFVAYTRDDLCRKLKTISYTLVIIVPVVPLVSMVSLAVSVRFVGDSSARSAYGVLGVCSCICEVLW